MCYICSIAMHVSLHNQCNVMSHCHTPHCMHKSNRATSFVHTHPEPDPSLSTPATTGLTSCQTNWHLNRHSVSGRTAAGTWLMMHLPLHSPPTATAAAIEGPWYTGLAPILHSALGTSHAGWSLPDSSSLKNHTQNWRCRMNSHVDWVIHTLNGPHGAMDTLY
jgi:hypothetical protein